MVIKMAPHRTASNKISVVKGTRSLGKLLKKLSYLRELKHSGERYGSRWANAFTLRMKNTEFGYKGASRFAFCAKCH
jgi:hypothetical protein